MLGLPSPVIVVARIKTGRFPHQAYRPFCDCVDGEPKDTRNYAGHVIAPPKCSSCGRMYRLDIKLMETR